jgi:hypothetical protein
MLTLRAKPTVKRFENFFNLFIAIFLKRDYNGPMPGLSDDILFFKGAPVFVNPLIVTRSYVQNKKHRRKRINKKWRKRYGMREVWSPGARWFDGSLFVHPEVFEAMQSLQVSRTDAIKSLEAFVTLKV